MKSIISVFFSLALENMGMSLAELWYLNLVGQLKWCWEHLLGLYLRVQLACFLYWYLEIHLALGKYIWLEFQFEHCVA